MLMPVAAAAPCRLLVACLGAAVAATAQCANVWSPLAPGLNGVVTAVATLPNGDLVAGGVFAIAGLPAADRIARWNGSAWSALGAGVQDPNYAAVFAVASLPNGDVVAGGTFATAGGLPVQSIARWNGGSWSALGAGVDSYVHALAVLPNGDVVAGGRFVHAGGISALRIARWDGTAWWPLGAGLNGSVFALLVLPNGDLVAGGDFTVAGGVSANCVARWDGTAWSPLGSGLSRNKVWALATLPDGDLVTGEAFTDSFGNGIHRVGRWNGASWSALGADLDGDVRALAPLPDGDFVAGGTFTVAGGVSANHVARWNGTAWSALGVGADGYVTGLAMTAAGDVVVGGYFTTAGGVPAACLARLSTTCPATALAVGAGCPGSGGANTLVAASLPWVDAIFRARGSGLPNVAIVVAATSFTAIPQGALPLASVFAQAPAGCDLLVAPDILQAYVTTTGSVESSFLLPNTPPIIGLTFHHQLVPIELDASGNVVAITATNALQLTAGAF